MLKNRQLTQFVHRTLVWRLLLMGFLIAVAAAALTYYLRRDDIAEIALARATRNVEIFQQYARQLVRERGLDSTQALHQALTDWHADLQMDRNGSFVLTQVNDLQGRRLFEHAEGAFSASITARRVLDGGEPALSRDGMRYEMLPLEGHPVIYLQTMIRDDNGKIVARARSLYLLSAETRASLERGIMASMSASAGIVALTTLLLYPVILLLTRRLGRMASSLLHANLEMLQVVGSAIAKRDSETDAHNYRVSLYAFHLGEALSLSRSEMRSLLKGALLHDVGKIGIRDHILLKPGALDAEEIRLMRQHVPLGLEIIARSQWLADAAEVVGGHHERFDGSGYPRALSGEEISLLARIFAIADVFDALCSVRPYKSAFPLDAALAIMRQASGQHFDPQLLEVFAGLAENLHARYAGRDDRCLREELNDLLRAAFTDKLSKLAG